MILASASPRRRALLAAGGVVARTVPADVDEAPRPGEGPRALVRRLARAKASTVARGAAGTVVLGADTVVVRGQGDDAEVLGKPHDRDEATAVLRGSSGARLVVLTGVAVVGRDGGVHVRDRATVLHMHAYDDRVVAAHVATGEPLGVAGGLRIQGRGAELVAARDGCWTNVVGLPTCTAAALLAPHAVTLVPDACKP